MAARFWGVLCLITLGWHMAAHFLGSLKPYYSVVMSLLDEIPSHHSFRVISQPHKGFINF